MFVLVLATLCSPGLINSDSSFTKSPLMSLSPAPAPAPGSPLLLSTSASYLGTRLKFPKLRQPSYNVSVPLGAAARLPCTVTNVEHQAVRVKYHVSRVTCHNITCHVSQYHMSRVTKYHLSDPLVTSCPRPVATRADKW